MEVAVSAWVVWRLQVPPVARLFLLFPCVWAAWDGASCSSLPFPPCPTQAEPRAERMLYIFLLYKHVLVYICFPAVPTQILSRCRRGSALTDKRGDPAILTPCAAPVPICLFVLCLPYQVFNKLWLNIFQNFFSTRPTLEWFEIELVNEVGIHRHLIWLLCVTDGGKQT